MAVEAAFLGAHILRIFSRCMHWKPSLSSLIVIAALIVQPFFCFGQDLDELTVQNQLSRKVGPEKAAKLVQRFGVSAIDSHEIEEALMKMLARRHEEVDRQRLDAAVDRVSSRDADNLAVEEKRQLARSWFLLYELAKQDLGSASEGLDRLRIATQLDPEEPSYAKELAFQEKPTRANSGPS